MTFYPEIFGYVRNISYLYTMKTNSLQPNTDTQIVTLTDENNGLKSKLTDAKKRETELLNKQSELLFRIAWLERKVFGRMSEKYIPEDPNALKLFSTEELDMLVAEQEVSPIVVQDVAAHTRQLEKKKAVRCELPASLRREETVIEPENIPEGAVRIGEERTEKLEYKPFELWVRVIVRPKYSIGEKVAVQRDCGEILIAKMPDEPINKGIAGASLLSHLLVSKYQDHLPFYRQLDIFKRHGVTISASTINDWFIASCGLLKPLYDLLQKRVLGSDYIQVDETTIPVCNDEKGKCVKGYMWMVRSVINKEVFFHYDNGSRSKDTAAALLLPFHGTLQCDGYSVYDMYEQKNGVAVLGCMAHVRRKFEQALTNDKALSEQALYIIGKLYEIERNISSLSYEEIKKKRNELSYPILQTFEKWVIDNKDKVLPSSPIGKALSYAWMYMPRLARYVLDGRYRIDNNLAENAIRPLVVGRKNYLFCGNNNAAVNAAIIYSLIGTCRIQEVNPDKWLNFVIQNIKKYKNEGKLELLLPKHFKNK